MVSKDFHQLYGFFESCFRITGQTGVNNAFWLTGEKVEIDIAEARFLGPAADYIHYGLHDWRKPYVGIGAAHSAKDLSKRYCNYGLLWLPDRLIYTFNGRAVATIHSRYPKVPVEIRFSTAVADFAGKIGDPVGSEMDVAWVHSLSLKE